MAIKLIVGLRNPGAAYAYTRHNAGGWFVEALAHDVAISFKVDKKLHSEIAQVETYKLVLPLEFMNHSGIAVQAVCQFYRLNPSEILVVHDELDLPAGQIKLKTGGGHGGHNGLRNIITQLGSTEFHRLRIGIGHPGHKELVLNYVLGKPSSHDRELILDAIARGMAVIPNVLAGDMAGAMNQLHR
jgi:PTH1 family peptidyl-tRNA hydrolase